MKKPKAYLASPYGFSESTKYFMDKVYIPQLRELVEVINPWELTTLQEIQEAEKAGKEHEFAIEIGERNKKAIDSCDIVIAAIDGQEIDSGTASEIGYAAGKGKKIFGYRNDLRKAGENGVVVSLQTHYFIESSGGKIASSLEELKKLLNETSSKV